MQALNQVLWLMWFPRWTDHLLHRDLQTLPLACFYTVSKIVKYRFVRTGVRLAAALRVRMLSQQLRKIQSGGSVIYIEETKRLSLHLARCECGCIIAFFFF